MCKGRNVLLSRNSNLNIGRRPTNMGFEFPKTLMRLNSLMKKMVIGYGEMPFEWKW